MVIIRSELRKRRISLGITQREAAEKSGIDYTYYSKIEAGTRTPAVKTWFRIGEALSIPNDQLIIYMREGTEG